MTTLAILQGQGAAQPEQLPQSSGSRIEQDSWTSPSCAYSTEDGLFSISPWAPEGENFVDEFFRLQDSPGALVDRIHEVSSNSGSARHGERPPSLESDPAYSDIGDTHDDDDDDECDDVLILDMGNDVDNDDVFAEGVDIDLPLSSPSFQMRVYDPGSTDYECSNEYSAEAIESAAEEWSGKVQELPSITEEESVAAEAMDIVATDIKRRSSDTIVQPPLSSKDHGIRRVSTMSDYQRLKGRHKSPKLVAFKASPAGPAITAMSVQPAEAWKVASMYEDATTSSHDSSVPRRRTSQTIQSDLGISQMLWEEPSSSSDSEITVLTGSGIDYLVADEIEEDNASPSPMERLKTKLKAWSWERELSEASPDNRSRFIPLIDTDERRHRRQSSDFVENPPGPPNTVRHSGQSSMINSDPQTPADPDVLEDDEDEPVMELKTKNSFRPIRGQDSNDSAAFSNDYLAIPRRTASLPSSRSMTDGDDACFPHRDSVDISHARMEWDEVKDKRSQELIMNSRDSFIITKSRLEAKHPKGSRSVTPPGGAITWRRFGGLSPIADASPPGVSLLEARKGKQKADGPVEAAESHQQHAHEHGVKTEKHKGRGSSKKKKVELVDTLEQESDEHDDCPICEAHRPRWFEAEHRES